MSYSTVPEMAQSPGLMRRLIGAAAQQGRADAPTWVEQNIYTLVARTSWVDLWEFAAGQKTVNVNPDTGARTDTISDVMVAESVEELIAAQTSPEPEPEEP